MESAVRLGAWMPFAQAARQLAHFVHTQVSEATVARLTEQAGAAYAAVQEAQAARLRADPGPAVAGPPLLQVSVDGAFVPLVHKAWAEAKTVAIGVVQPPLRRAGGAAEVHATELSYFSRAADCRTFTDQATVEVVRRGALTAGTVCGVVDGAVWEQEFLAVQCPAAVRILDWPHAVGSLAKVAQALYGADTDAARAWLAVQREALLHGDPQAVLRKLRGLQDELTLQAGGGPPPPALAVLTDSLDYLAKRADQLRYAAFRALGYPIGSGAVESANKLVVEARLKGAGMHWAPGHVNPLLALRGMACSDRWEEGWPQLAAQWRAQSRAATARRRQRRQAARQAAAAHDAGAAGGPVPAVAAPPAALPPASRPRPAPREAGAAPPVRARPDHPTTRRPAATHPWRRPFHARRSPTRSDPEM